MDMDLLRKMAESRIWDIDADSYFPYQFPLSTAKDMIEIGKAIGGQHPADETMYELGCFILSKSPASHVSPFKWAMDFLVPDGTPVFAAYDGKVTEVELNSKEWGPTEEFAQKLNYITIRHHQAHRPFWEQDNDEFSQYCHLAIPTQERPQLVKVGDRVKTGQQISYVEKNGWTDRDHLHFVVFRGDSNPFGFKSLKVNFK